MSEESRLLSVNPQPRVLVIGQDQQLLDLVVNEVRAAGIEARGMTAAH